MQHLSAVNKSAYDESTLWSHIYPEARQIFSDLQAQNTSHSALARNASRNILASNLIPFNQSELQTPYDMANVIMGTKF